MHRVHCGQSMLASAGKGSQFLRNFSTSATDIVEMSTRHPVVSMIGPDPTRRAEPIALALMSWRRRPAGSGAGVERLDLAPVHRLSPSPHPQCAAGALTLGLWTLTLGGLWPPEQNWSAEHFLRCSSEGPC